MPGMQAKFSHASGCSPTGCFHDRHSCGLGDSLVTRPTRWRAKGDYHFSSDRDMRLRGDRRRACRLDGRDLSRALHLTVTHTGFPDGISGSELLARMRVQAVRYGAEIRRAQEVPTPVEWRLCSAIRRYRNPGKNGPAGHRRRQPPTIDAEGQT